jgi:hypothetical protein
MLSHAVMVSYDVVQSRLSILSTLFVAHLGVKSYLFGQVSEYFVKSR